MRSLIIGMVFVFAAAAAQAQEKTFVVKNGAFPWHDRVNQWHLENVPEKYVSDKPLPQQSCSKRSLALPGDGVKQALIAVPLKQLDDFSSKYAMTDTGDRLCVKGRGKVDYAIVVYRNPPKNITFSFSRAGVILLGLAGDYKTASPSAAPKPAAQGTYVPGEKASPWHDRVGKWCIVNVPKQFTGNAVPQQACNHRTLVVPAGTPSATIAVANTDLAKLKKAFPKIKDTNLDMGIQLASGGKVHPYSIFTYPAPPAKTTFSGFGAGVILLAVDGAAPVAQAAIKAPAANEYVPGEKAFPWHDRVGRWCTINVPKQFTTAAVPQQSCNDRTLVVPAGLKAVTIAVSDGDLSKLKAAWPQIVDTGLDMGIQAPSGGRILPYSIYTYPNPPAKTTFKGFGAGVVVVALSGTEASAATVAKPTTGVSGILQNDQQFDAQEWPFKPGRRSVAIHVEEPPAGITKNTGMMLVLHNWGGTYSSSRYIAWCKEFAQRFNVIAISVNYLQSGRDWNTYGPYDHGYLQAMDGIGALYTIRKQLIEKNVAFNEHRIYAMGGSGGGNVAEMVAKLAPRTFACVVDICGMPGLTDGIAFGTGEYGSRLNAGYSRDPNSANYLSTDMQEIRDFGNLEHCKLRKQVNSNQKIVIVHGVNDRSCPVVHKIGQFQRMVMAGIDVDGHFLTPFDVDGVAVTSTGHSVGNRNKVVIKYADVYMKEDGKFAKATTGPSDFAAADTFSYPTTNGKYVIDYTAYPTITFVKNDM